MQTRIIKTLCILGLSVVLSSCAIFHRNPPPPKAKLQNFQQTLSVRAAWSQQVGKGTQKHYVKLTPKIIDGRIIAVSFSGTVTCMDLTNGRKLWSTNIREPITAGPGAGKNVVVIGTGNGGVVALSLDNGQYLWRSEVGSEVLAAPLVTNRHVLVKAENDRLYGLNIKTGKEVWEYKQPIPTLVLRGSGSIKVYGNNTISGFSSGQMASVNIPTGQVVWTQKIAEPQGAADIERMIDIDDTPVIAGNTVYAATYQGKLAALNARSGKILWDKNFSAYAGLTYSMGNLYASDTASDVYAFDAKNGSVLWHQHNLFGRYLTGPAVVSGALAVGDAEGYLHFLALSDGHFVARVRVDKRGIIANPVVYGNMIYVYGNSGRLVAYRVS